MAAYFAVTRRDGKWSYVCSGNNPETVQQQARMIIEGQDQVDEDLIGHAPYVEAELLTLRVVPEETARQMQLVYPAVLAGNE